MSLRAACLVVILFALVAVVGCAKPQQLHMRPPTAAAKQAFVYEPIREPVAHRSVRPAARPAFHRPRRPALPEHEPEWEVHGAVRPWRFIVIHHSATHRGSAAVFDRWHRNHNGWDELGYHFVIGNGTYSPDGEVEVGSRWPKQKHGAHCKVGQDETYNDCGIGICLVGNFDRGRPTARQMEALVGLVNYLQVRCAIPTDHVYGHRHVRPEATHCPGEMFPWYDLLPRLRH